MQGLDWNDLRVALAVFRRGAFSAAAAELSVDHATVARRLARLEAQLGAQVFERDGQNRLRATAAGARVVQAAERAADEIAHMRAAAAGADAQVAGVVRLTAVPILANKLLAPAAADLAAAHPDLILEIVGEPQNRDLVKREADMALRLARPAQGGARVTAQRIGWLDYAVWTARDRDQGPVFVGYVDDAAHLPPARWTADLVAAQPGARRSGLRVADAATLIEAVAAGAGLGVLPSAAAARDPRLRRQPMTTPQMRRELWLLQHRDLSGLARMRAVADWLRGVANDLAGNGAGGVPDDPSDLR